MQGPKGQGVVEPAVWILLRGLAREKDHWGEFPAQLSERLKGARVLSLDLPGAGEFHKTPSPSSIAEIALLVRRQWEQQKPDAQPVGLVAVSMGAMVALEWIRQAPEEVSGAVIMNSSLRSLSSPHERLRFQMWTHFLRSLVAQNPEARERQILKIISQRLEVHEQVALEWGKIYRRRPVKRINVLRQVLAASRFDIDEWPYTHPILLLCGLGDRLVEPSCSEALHKKFGWPLRQHPWAGHDITLDDGPWVAEQVASWWNEVMTLSASQPRA